MRALPGARTRKSGGAKTVKSSLAGFRSAPRKNAVGRLPERERRFIGNKKTVRRRDDCSSRRGLRHEIPFRDDFALLILLPGRIKGSAHHPDIRLRTLLRRNFRALDNDTQVLLAKHSSLRQSNFKGAQRAIAGIFEFIDDVEMDAAGRSAGNKDLRLPIGKLIAGAEGMDAARREECPRAEDSREKNTQP